MRIIIFTNHFSPESFRCNDVAFDLASRGHEVKVMTSIPYYPEGHYNKGYSLFKRRRETVRGVEIVRVPVIPTGEGGAIRLSLTYLSSIFSFFFHGLWQALFNRFDCVLVHDTSPAFICLPAKRLAGMQKIPMYLWILDMWPESLVCGGISGGAIYKSVGTMMKHIYASCSRILISSHGFAPKLLEQDVPPEKIIYFPNWCDTDVENQSSSADIPTLPKGFKVMFAGNIGDAQDIGTVAQAARLNRQDNIHWIFLGDGRKKAWLERFVSDNGLEDCVHILGRYPSSTMMSFFSQADVMLVSLKSSLIGDMTLPARVQSFMNAGKAIVAMAGGETSEVIKSAGCGWTVGSGDAVSLAKAVSAASKLPGHELEKMGKAGSLFCLEHFNRNQILEKLNSIISESQHHPAL